jgi:hypothetical protein
MITLSKNKQKYVNFDSCLSEYNTINKIKIVRDKSEFVLVTQRYFKISKI